VLRFSHSRNFDCGETSKSKIMAECPGLYSHSKMIFWGGSICFGVTILRRLTTSWDTDFDDNDVGFTSQEFHWLALSMHLGWKHPCLHVKEENNNGLVCVSYLINIYVLLLGRERWGGTREGTPCKLSEFQMTLTVTVR